jgi:hypothetical protein
MSDQDRRQAQPEPGQEGGLFGNLPSARPGVRSPRRRAQGKKERSPQTPRAPESAPPQAGKAAPPSAPRPDPGTASPSARPETAREPEPAGTHDAPGVEDLAWAGVTVAAEAATLGVRLLSRAIEAVRKPADDR